MSTLGELLRELRGKRSLREIAEEAGISHTYLRDVELGVRGSTKTPLNPSPDTLKRLATVYNVSYEELMQKAGYLDNSISKYIQNAIDGAKAPGRKDYKQLSNEQLGAVDELEMKRNSMAQEAKSTYSKGLKGAKPAGDRIEIPIIGVVTAGPNGPAFEEHLGYEVADEDDLNEGSEYYWLKIKGDSMKDIGIFEGDLALFRVQPMVESGDIAIVVVNGDEGTLKRVHIREDSIVLEAANPAYPPRIFVGADMDTVRIVGKVKEIKRKF